MKYLIFCKKTHKHLATYTNAKTLETLDTDKCYFKEEEPVKKKQATRTVSAKITVTENPKSSNKFSSSSDSNTTNDYMNPLNPMGFYAAQSYSDNSYNSSSSSSCDSSSSYSDSSSSSSCDSSSW